MRPRRAARDESRYRVRRTGTSKYFTSRQAYEGLDIVLRRYPSDEVSGSAFVLVHGIGVSSRYFQPAAAELAHTGTVYLVDLPGYGSAPRSRRPVSISDHALVLAAVVKHSRLVNPVIVGHPMGSQVVSKLAVDFPMVSNRIVLMAPTMYPAYRRLGVAIAKLMKDIWREPLRVKLIAGIDYLFRCGLPFFFQQVPRLLGDRIEDRMPYLQSRVLVMRGDDDVIVLREWAILIWELASRGTFTEVVGPHVVMFTAPISVAREIAAHG